MVRRLDSAASAVEGRENRRGRVDTGRASAGISRTAEGTAMGDETHLGAVA